ncbi:MAG: hypothetical protein Kow0075_17160 [Salibacteraceae bacterium]
MSMINGIQQVGIGTTDVHKSWEWYRKHFGFDVPVFDEAADAPLMSRYTGGEVQSRHAILAMNLNGGGGMEIWQFTSRNPSEQPPFSLLRSGLLVACIKCQNIAAAHKHLARHGASEPSVSPCGEKNLTLTDPFGNPFLIKETDYWFKKNHGNFGGIEGFIIGVSNMEASLRFYQSILEIDEVVFDETRVFEDFDSLPDGDHQFRRVRLKPKQRNSGAFSEILGDFFIELLQPVGVEPLAHNFKDRYWGDQGYIHLCFDVNRLEVIGKRAQHSGHPFTVDSGTAFDMGEAAGRFAYLEDPDGTLIELVETDRITLSKLFKWKLKLNDKRKQRPLPRWFFSVLALSRVTD